MARKVAEKTGMATFARVEEVRAPLNPAHVDQGLEATSAAESPFRRLDRDFHAELAGLTAGMSPIALREAFEDWALHMALSPGRHQEILEKGIEKWLRLGRYLAGPAFDPDGAPVITPLPQDERFRHEGWRHFPFNVMGQSFLLAQQWWHNATDTIAGVRTENQRLVEFCGRQWLDMLSPSNFVATNPEILERTITERGANLVRGFSHFRDDAERILRHDGPAGAEAFVPGKTVAVTPGEVIFRNELIELIQYRPATGQVRPEPVLVVPAWIMKYYILDLSPENSLIRYLVGQGFTVFCISWRNPGKEQRDLSFDDYRRLGIMAALDAIGLVVPGEKVHATGYCLGGTTLAIAAAAMAREGDDRLKSLSLFAAQVDFEEPGELGLFITESQVAFLESLMWKEGTLDQARMSGAFQLLRSKDLVWSRMVKDYLMGDRPEINDLMAWNADATRLPYRMHSEYLRRLYMENELAEGRYRIGDRAIYLEDIRAPVFAVATLSDHVAPWHSVFKLIHLLDTDVTFALTSGGHNAGIVSEPGHKNRSFRLLDHPRSGVNPDPDAWLAASTPRDGSWWPQWVEWLEARSGAPVAPPPIGNPDCLGPLLGAAPGTYVLEH